MELPEPQPSKWSSKGYTEYALSNWTNPLIQGPWDIGFTESYITIGGIQVPPYAFIRNSTIEKDVLENDVRYWRTDNYSMPHGISKILKPGEGTKDWDSSYCLQHDLG